jgi:hypothetical protein
LGSILQEEAIVSLIYHWEESSIIFGSSSSGVLNPWSSFSSVGRTDNLRVRLNPSLYWSVHLLLQPWEAYFVSPGAFCMQLILLS